ncbi:MAG: DUF2914 domain-containing protein [Thiohalophilus sp.]
MIRHYGLLLAMLLGSGQLAVAQQATETDQQTMPATAAAEQEEDTGEAQDAAREQSGFSSGSVMRSAFTTRVEDREPVDDVERLENDTREVYYFTELRDMEDQTVLHRWEYQGEVMAEVEFNVKGPRWRVWSKKRIMSDWTGEWTVSVINAAGEVVSTDSFSYVEAASSADDTGETEEAPPEEDDDETSDGEADTDSMTPDADSSTQD